MLTEGQVRESLDEVLVPGVKRSLVMMNLVRNIAITNGAVTVTLASSALSEGVQAWLRDKVVEVAGKLPSADSVQVEFVDAKPAELSQIRNVVAVMSGKGGVGKSLVTSLIAVALRREGG